MMSIRWPSYILILITALLGLLIPLILPQLWRLGLKKPSKAVRSEKVADSRPHFAAPIAIRFHLAALLFLGFLGLANLLLPLLFGVRRESGNLAMIILSGIAVPMVIVLFYCLRKGDLSWSAPKSREEGILDEGSRK